MERYKIADLERLSGIKAHTIRIWEKRYNLFAPERTDTNIRYYNDDLVKKLLNISTLLECGHKISKIANYSTHEFNTSLNQCRQVPDEHQHNFSIINQLIICAIDLNEIEFDKIITSEIQKMGMYNAVMQVIYPFLHKVGLLWTLSELAPAHEHFASQIIRRKLLTAINALPIPEKSDKTFLLFLPPNEWHEIALIFSDYLIRNASYSTLYLGQNVPLHDIADIIKKRHITHIITFYIARKEPEQIAKEIEFIKGNRNLPMLISYNSDAINLPNYVTQLKSPAQLLSYL